MGKQREISKEEIQFTLSNIETQKRQMRVLEFNKKKLNLYLEELPLLEESTREKIVECDRQLKTSQQAIDDGLSFLQKNKEVKP